MRVTVAITGASGSVYAARLVELLSAHERVDRIYVIFSPTARRVFDHEVVGGASRIEATPKVQMLAPDDYFASVASGSNAADAMVVVPCSAGTMGRIASGVSLSLIERAADVQLKERLPLVLVLRETPLSLIHLRNMTTLVEAGAVVMPACPSFYAVGDSVIGLVDSVVERVMDKISIENDKKYRWAEK